MKRQTEKQVLNEISESDSDRELTNPNMEKSKSIKQNTILEYVNEVRQNLIRQQERNKTLKMKETQNIKKTRN